MMGTFDAEEETDKEETPKESLSYRDAILNLRSRLQAICPMPEVSVKPSGASALEFYKYPEQSLEASLPGFTSI